MKCSNCNSENPENSRYCNRCATTLTFTNGYEGTFTNKSKISAIPIKLGFFYTLPMSNETSFFFNVGVGYYLSKYSFEMNYEENGYQEDMIQEARGNGFGFHGGMGFEFNFSSNVALIVGGQGRYAKIGGFEGTREHLYGTSYKEEGILYYYELRIGAKKYPMVFIHEDEPSDPFISKVREAKVDFSGFTIMAGLIFRF